MDGIRGNVADNKGAHMSFEIEEDVVKQLRNQMKNMGGTLYMGLMAGFSILLSKYSGQEDIVIGTPIAGRRHPQMENVAGLFVNALAIRSKPESNKDLEEYLKEIKQKLLKAYENQEYPFIELVEEVYKKRDPSRNPLYDVMLAFQNTESVEIKLENLSIESYGIDSDTVKYDITLIMAENREKLQGKIEYKTKLFNQQTIQTMIKHYIKILKKLGEKRKCKIKDIDILD